MGNHNVLYTSVKDSFQKGRKPPPPEVETGRHVGKDLVAWETGGQEGNLTLQVVLLFPRRHAGVDDTGRRCCDGRARWIRGRGVAAVAAGGGGVAQHPVGGPLTQGLGSDPETRG